MAPSPTYEYVEVAVPDLMLDGNNPRHDSVTGQREAIQTLLDVDGTKIVRLAEDIVANGGLSPIDLFLVIRKDRATSSSFTVIEGNRRTAALKLLTNPDLASSHPSIRSRFKALSRTATVPHFVRCAVATSREEAKHWQELRHTGERGGAGVVPWNAEATQRFAGRRGSQSDKGLQFVEAVQRAYVTNQSLQRDLATVRKDRLTTLGRLVSDPWVRDRLGLKIEAGQLLVHYDPRLLEGALSKILEDLAGSVTVSELKTKDQRMKYISNLGSVLPDPNAHVLDAIDLAVPVNKMAKPNTKPTKPAAPTPVSKKPLFDGVVLANLGARIPDLLNELRQLDVNRFPNASAALTRVVIELAVGQVYAIKNKPQAKLREQVKYCLSQVDKTGKDQRFQAVRTGLNDGNSLSSVATMHAFMHNPHFHPSATEVRTIAANYSHFLASLDSLV